MVDLKVTPGFIVLIHFTDLLTTFKSLPWVKLIQDLLVNTLEDMIESFSQGLDLTCLHSDIFTDSVKVLLPFLTLRYSIIA